jgi:hypothetical protein
MSSNQSGNEEKISAPRLHRFFQHVSNNNLDLSRQNLTDKDMPEIIQFLLQNPNVKALDLSLNNIGDEGIAYFAERNQHIISANFEGNNISDQGVAVFAYKNQAVEEVNFSHNLISDQGISNFVKINEICLHSQFSTIQLH